MLRAWPINCTRTRRLPHERLNPADAKAAVDAADADDAEFHEAVELEPESQLRVRFDIIRNERIENVGKYQSCVVSKIRFL